MSLNLSWYMIQWGAVLGKKLTHCAADYFDLQIFCEGTALLIMFGVNLLTMNRIIDIISEFLTNACIPHYMAYSINTRVGQGFVFSSFLHTVRAILVLIFPFHLSLFFPDYKAVNESGPAIWSIEPHDVLPCGEV